MVKINGRAAVEGEKLAQTSYPQKYDDALSRICEIALREGRSSIKRIVKEIIEERIRGDNGYGSESEGEITVYPLKVTSFTDFRKKFVEDFLEIERYPIEDLDLVRMSLMTDKYGESRKFFRGSERVISIKDKERNLSFEIIYDLGGTETNPFATVWNIHSVSFGLGERLLSIYSEDPKGKLEKTAKGLLESVLYSLNQYALESQQGGIDEISGLMKDYMEKLNSTVFSLADMIETTSYNLYGWSVMRIDEDYVVGDEEFVVNNEDEEYVVGSFKGSEELKITLGDYTIHIVEDNYESSDGNTIGHGGPLNVRLTEVNVRKTNGGREEYHLFFVGSQNIDEYLPVAYEFFTQARDELYEAIRRCKALGEGDVSKKRSYGETETVIESDDYTLTAENEVYPVKPLRRTSIDVKKTSEDWITIRISAQYTEDHPVRHLERAFR